jgi:hypothetical protein
LVFGAPLNLPAECVTADKPPDSIIKEMASFLPCVAPLQLPPPSPPPAALMRAMHVYVWSPPAAPSLTPAYRGPFQVVSKGTKFLKIVIGTRIESVSADRLKAHVGDSPVAAAPLRRGRPPPLHQQASPPVAKKLGGPL